MSDGKTIPEPLPHDFVIGRDTFFDFGPPFHYFEVIAVFPDGRQSRISRILITPPADACTQPAQIEVKEVTVSESIAELLAGSNPCSIPQSTLHKEQKRCKHCLTFSGVDVNMRVQCSGIARHIPIEILDRDIYDPAHAKTPRQTSWTMQLLGRLDAALGPGPMQKPIFAITDSIRPPPVETALLRELAARRVDDLFPRTTLTLSAVYRQAMHPPPQPSVYVVSSEPPPSTSNAPLYPPTARLAHVSGRVQFTAAVGTDGHPTGIHVEGHPLLKNSVEAALSTWTYANASPGTSLSGVIAFRNYCPSQAP